MIDKPDDKNANWREKYLDALDRLDHIEKSLGAQQELLRRAVVRVSVAADGQDDALDGVLSQLRESMRGTITGDINNLLAHLDEVVLNFEENREQKAQDIRQSLSDTIRTLQNFDLTRSVKKDISQYLSQLPERSKKVRLYPALLQQLANIQQQALKEIEQPKTSFLQKIFGENNRVKENDNSTSMFAEDAAEYVPAKLITELSGERKIFRTSGNYAQNSVEIAGTSVSGAHHYSEAHLPQKFSDQLIQVINQFFIGLENEAPMVKKVNALRERLDAEKSADTFIKTLEALRDLVLEAYISTNQAFANYLKNVNQELADIYSLVGGAVQSGTNLRYVNSNLQDSMRKGVESIESSAELATDLVQLKNSVQSQIGNIKLALDQFQHNEQQQSQLTMQLEALATKIKSMEHDAEKNRSVLEKQRFKALHDPLTELPNREYYNERASYEFQRWQRYNRPLTLAVFDIDHFKIINDSHGHQTGDRVLKVIGRSVAKRLREVDFFCRFGGEEFIALMPETSLADAMPVLDSIRAAIANASFNYKDQPISITLSIGATEFKYGDDVEIAFARADKALYAAKSNGRNCIRSAV